MLTPVEYVIGVGRETLTAPGESIAVAVPRFVTGVVFPALAYVVIRVILS